MGFAAEFFRHLTRRTGRPSQLTNDEELPPPSIVPLKLAAGMPTPPPLAVQRSLEAIAQVDRNANQSTLVEAWLDDLLVLSRGLAVQRQN